MGLFLIAPISKLRTNMITCMDFKYRKKIIPLMEISDLIRIGWEAILCVARSACFVVIVLINCVLIKFVLLHLFEAPTLI